ncbi:MAG: hypothetical protein H6702_12440 [Myxococcales bacterium]|nr:hypothetical protein [Myxococcales bacterium]
MRRWILVLGLGVLGCEGEGPCLEPLSPEASVPADGAPGRPGLDGGELDGGARDRGPGLDARPDGGGPGATDGGVDGTADGGTAEAGLQDGLPLDALPVDALPVDALPVDAGAPDAAAPGEVACFNGEDDDGDGRVDCADPDCRAAVACIGFPETCDNGVDDNGDDWVDCDDVYCHGDLSCPLPAVQPYTTAELQAVLLADCAGCHTQGGNDGELVLDPPFADALINVPSSQLALMRVAPGKRDDSYLFYKVRYRHHQAPGGGGGGEGMPPHAPWSAQKVERLGLWIDGLDD